MSAPQSVRYAASKRRKILSRCFFRETRKERNILPAYAGGNVSECSLAFHKPRLSNENSVLLIALNSFIIGNYTEKSDPRPVNDRQDAREIAELCLAVRKIIYHKKALPRAEALYERPGAFRRTKRRGVMRCDDNGDIRAADGKLHHRARITRGINDDIIVPSRRHELVYYRTERLLRRNLKIGIRRSAHREIFAARVAYYRALRLNAALDGISEVVDHPILKSHYQVKITDIEITVDNECLLSAQRKRISEVCRNGGFSHPALQARHSNYFRFFAPAVLHTLLPSR